MYIVESSFRITDYVEDNLVKKELTLIGKLKNKVYKIRILPFLTKGSLSIEVSEFHPEEDYYETLNSNNWNPKSSGLPWQAITSSLYNIVDLKGNTNPLEDRFSVESIVEELVYKYKFRKK